MLLGLFCSLVVFGEGQVYRCHFPGGELPTLEVALGGFFGTITTF